MPSGKGRRPRGSKVTMPATPPASKSVVEMAVTAARSLRPNVILRLRHITPSGRHPQSALTPYNGSGDGSYALVSQPEAPAESPPPLAANDVTNTIESQLKTFNARVRTNDVEQPRCCFWDTQPFFTPPVYVPIRVTDDTIHARGSFCSPECAAADILMHPSIDADPHEQLALLNYLYGPIYMLDTPIHPAPNPRGILNTLGGPLTIEEYRSAFRSGKQLQALPYPLVRYVSEVHLITPRPEQARVMRGCRQLVANKTHT
jgi:hypothetical protein